LFSDAAEQVSLQRLAPGAHVFPEPAGGAELLVLAGELMVGDHSCVRGSWIRLPAGDRSQIVAGVRGATFYFKTGHLAAVAAQV
jgi:hypothetical protein